MTGSRPRVDWHTYDAVLFDVDGVLTATATVHAACWRRMFDEYLGRRAGRLGEAFRPFDVDTDYKLYVDGKPRYDGVRSFLESRGIELPQGDPEDPPDRETICGLGNRKNQLIHEVLASDGVEVYPGSATLVGYLHEAGVKMATVSSSRNAEAVLKAAGIEALFEVRIDGVVAARDHLPGKPAPDIFLAGARELGVDPGRAVVVEDALSGVEAGRAGGFGLVIGVDREGHPEALKRKGADLVVSDLSELVPE